MQNQVSRIPSTNKGFQTINSMISLFLTLLQGEYSDACIQCITSYFLLKS